MKRVLVGAILIISSLVVSNAMANDLDEVKKSGVLRHLGVRYANFVTGQGDGLSVEVLQLFAKKLGVRYAYVETDWQNVIPDLIGKQLTTHAGKVTTAGVAPIRGDVIGNGMTILPWREQLLDFSTPTFPTQVWLVAGMNSKLRPIVVESEAADIAATMKLLRGQTLLGKKNTCLDPSLYAFADAQFSPVYFQGSLNEMFGAVMQGQAEVTLLDVADALIAISRWPGQVKILGPISEQQVMGLGFRKESPRLRAEFNLFFNELKKSGDYARLVKKYYPDVFDFYPEFFNPS